MSKMKVLHIWNDFIEYNGLTATFLELAKATDYDTFDLGLCVFAYEENDRGKEFESLGGRLYSLGEPYSSIKVSRAFVNLYKFIRHHKPDVVQTYEQKSNLVGVLAAALARVPIICGAEVTMRDLRGSGRRHLKRQLLTPAVSLAVRYCDMFIFNSEAVREDWTKGKRNEKFAVLYPPFDLGKYEAARSAAVGEAPTRVGPTIGFVGRLHEQKGLSILLEAMALVKKRMPAVQLVLVGEGPLEDELRASAKQLGLEGNVYFAGFKSNVFEYLTGMDVLVAPSRTEGFGMAALEAMVMGIPVVASAVGGLKEIVVDGETGTLVPYGSPVKLADAVTELLSDDKRRLEMGKKGRERAFAVFHPSKYTKSLENLYLQLYREKARQ